MRSREQLPLHPGGQLQMRADQNLLLHRETGAQVATEVQKISR